MYVCIYAHMYYVNIILEQQMDTYYVCMYVCRYVDSAYVCMYMYVYMRVYMYT